MGGQTPSTSLQYRPIGKGSDSLLVFIVYLNPVCLFTQWRKFWFVLDHSGLKYYAGPEAEEVSHVQPNHKHHQLNEEEVLSCSSEPENLILFSLKVKVGQEGVFWPV